MLIFFFDTIIIIIGITVLGIVDYILDNKL